jgi:small subunit ribosomal protein S2
MDRMPGVMFLVDTRREHIAVKEARKLGVKTIALIDTDSDPDLIDLPVPGNDDAMRAIELIVHELAEAVIEGKSGRVDKGGEDHAQQPKRRSSRSQFRAEDQPAHAAHAPAEVSGPSADIPPPSDSAPVEKAPAETVAAQMA